MVDCRKNLGDKTFMDSAKDPECPKVNTVGPQAPECLRVFHLFLMLHNFIHPSTKYRSCNVNIFPDFNVNGPKIQIWVLPIFCEIVIYSTMLDNVHIVVILIFQCNNNPSLMEQYAVLAWNELECISCFVSCEPVASNYMQYSNVCIIISLFENVVYASFCFNFPQNVSILIGSSEEKSEKG